MDVTREQRHLQRVFCCLAAITAHFDLDTVQLDFVNAYLNGQLDEEVYTKLADGFSEPGWALKLLKALYGLRRSGYLWQEDLKRKLIELDFGAVDDESCVFTEGVVILFFYVDDVVLLARKESRTELEMRRQQLKEAFEARDLGELAWFLNERIIRDREKR